MGTKAGRHHALLSLRKEWCAPRLDVCPLFFAVVDRDPHDMIGAALVDQKIAVRSGSHMPHDAGVDVAGRDWPTLELLALGIEAHQHVGTLAGLVVPDDVIDDFKPV